ncbi:MAG TPA: hypothetical protein VL371_05555, partial [Gemmataceae bacterium]|nr:hypothetical protein [Gemmataceae bacterium]
MTHMHPLTDHRRTARILAVAIAGLGLPLFVAMGGFNPLTLTARETALMVPFLMAVAALFVVWRSELADGVLTAGGVLFLMGLNWEISDGLPRGWSFEAITVLGSLLVICTIMDKSHDTTLPHNRV